MAIDEEVFPIVARNNSQFKRRFALSNSTAVRAGLREGTHVAGVYPQIRDSLYEVKTHNLAASLASLQLPVPSVQKLYHERIVEKQKMLDMVRAAASMIESPSDDVYETFTALAESLFGRPTKAMFQPIYDSLGRLIRSGDVTHLMPDERSLLESVFARVPVSTPFADDCLQEFFPITSDPTEPVVVSAVAVKALFDTWLSDYGLQHWTTSIRKRSRGFSVNTSKRLVLIPSEKFLKNRKFDRALTEKKLRAIFAHEVLTHVVRYEAGIASPCRLLGAGLPGYLGAEEGIASYREHQIMEIPGLAGIRSYLVIGLAYGLDWNNQKRSFAAVYKIVMAVLRCVLHCDEQYARMKAFALCSRSMLLIDYRLPLVVPHDLLYRTGHDAVRRMLETISVTDDVLNIGKYDPMNHRHIGMLVDLNIIPANHALVQYSQSQ